ncbi:MAG: TonB-dependent receptor plug domain-containing protein [Ahniella sp.]|nr:TonB-dependent receptor plug domain-containing protein [Ahniella sp.]
MKKNKLSWALSLALASSVATLAPLQCVSAQAIAENSAADKKDDARKLQPVVVTGEITYRDRTEAPSTLVYDLAYFQRFEPLTVGDMLKRVPSVAFLSDVLEYDGVRLRGLDPGYTQILINGKRVPGAGFDRSFFVDRIPAELVERIEIVRSSSADRSGDAVAGSLNIVLRDGYTLDGGYVRAGALHYNDDEIEPSLSAVWGGEAMGGRLLLGANAQGRRNPKDKFSQRFDEPGGTLENTEVQTDVRSGEDYSFNADYSRELGAGYLSLNAFFVRTDRLQDEDSLEYRSGIENDANLLTINDNDIDIRTDNWFFGGEYEFPMADGNTRVRLGYAGFDDDQFEFEDEYEFLRDSNPFPEDDRFTGDQVFTDIRDRELSAELRHERDVGDNEIKFGVDFTRKQRETSITAHRHHARLCRVSMVRSCRSPVA